MLIFPIAVAVFSRMDQRNLILAAKLSLLVYIFGLGLERLNPDLPGTFVQGYRGSDDRGYRSFTSEPSYLGLAGFALTIVLLYTKQSRIWLAGSILITVASMSMAAIMPMLIAIGLTVIKPRHFPKLLIFVVILIVTYRSIENLDMRFVVIATTMIENPWLIFEDVSFLNRIVRATAPITNAFHDGFIPHVFPDEGDISVVLPFSIIGVDEFVENLPNLLATLIYVYGFLSLPLFFHFARHARGPLYLFFSIFALTMSLLSTGVPFVFAVIALTFRRDRVVFSDRSQRFPQPIILTGAAPIALPAHLVLSSR